MVEIRKAPELAADPDLSSLVDEHDTLIGELCPQNATAVWKVESSEEDLRRVRLHISDAYGRSSRLLNVVDLIDGDRMVARVSRLVGDLVYQQCENLQDPGTLAHLASFTPGRLCLRFIEHDPNIPLPSAEDTQCALLFADISGFTSLTERLARKGAVGAEELTAALNRYFGELIDIVNDYGGDVLKFAGDALLASFEDRVRGAALRDAAGRALAASLVIQHKMQDFPEVEGTKLSLKIALAAGDLRMLHLGGVFGRCELLMVGDALKELGDANDLAGPDDIIAARSFWSCVDSLASATPLENGNVRIKTLQARDAEDYETSQGSGQTLLVDAPFRPSSVAAMRGYIPAAIYARLAAGQTDWLGELRKVTVVFANLPGFNRDTPLQNAQQLMVTLQRTVYQFEGSLNKLSVDDKGVSLLAGFGLPPVAHEDDAARAIGCALELHDRIRSLGWKCSIGVATGRIFCGAYGNNQRREYTMIGDTVNTSARLMQAAKGHILCEQATWREAETRFDFETLEPLRMKGKAEPVPCFRPQGRRIREVRQTDREITVIGRAQERELFNTLLTRLVTDRQCSVLFFEGEAGVGKSHLLESFHQSARKAECRVLSGHGDAIERSTPWFGWRPIISGVIGVGDNRLEPEWLERAIRDRFDVDEELVRLLPLLSSVLSVTWPDNEWTAQMKGAIRGVNVDLLMTRLLQQAAQQKPLVILLEDAQWFDSASLALLREVATRVEPVLIVAAARTLTRPVPKDVETILKLATTEHVQLDVLPADDAVHMARHLLECSSLPSAVEELIRERTQGHPLFVEELAYTLRDSGTIEVVNGVGRLQGDLHEFAAREAADSLDGVVVNRIDRLPPSEQLTVKVASAIGYEFPYPMLRDIFPVERERGGIRDCLKTLDESRVTRPIEDRVDDEYAFRNRMLRDVAYNLVLKKHRVELHHAIALWIEEHHSEELDAHSPLLAEHWLQAGETRRAVDYLARAGERALTNNANREAARFYRKALRCEAELEERIEPMQRALWHRRFGEALYRHGELTLSLQHLRKALKLFGHPDSVSLVGKAAFGTWELTRQLFNRCRSRMFGKPAGRPSEALIESVRAYERLCEIHYMRNDMPAFLLSTFRSLNLAERYGFCPELGRAYSSSSITVSTMQLYKAADRYVARARRIAEKSGDLPSIAYARVINCIHMIGTGQWENARETLDYGLQLCEEIGDRRRWSEATALTMNLLSWTGDWDLLFEHGQKLRRAAEAENVAQVVFWAMGWLMWVESARSPDSELSHEVEPAITSWIRGDEEMPLADEVLARGGLLMPRVRRGEWASAIAVANEIEVVLGYSQPIAIYLLPTYCVMADLYYALSVSNYSSPLISQREVRRRMRLMHFRIQVFSVLMPIATPLRYLSAGRRCVLKGRLGKARRILKKGIRSGERYNIPYFIAMLETELARIVDSDSERDTLNASATERFRQLGIENPDVLWLRPDSAREARSD